MGAPLLSDYLWPDVAQGRQPQTGLFKPDTSNPLVNGLQFALVGPALFDSVTNSSGSGGGTTAVVPQGVGYNIAGTSGIATFGTNSNWNLADGADFLVQVGIFQTAPSGYGGLIGKRDTLSATGDWSVYHDAAGHIFFECAGGSTAGTMPLPAAAGYHVIQYLRKGGTLYAFLDGVQVTSTGVSFANSGNTSSLRLGVARDDATSENWLGTYTHACIWHGTAPELSQVPSLAANPWQLFATPASISFAAAASGGGTAVNPGVGSIALTGYAPTLAQTANQAVAPDVGSIAITGYAPTIAQPQTAAPGAGSIALTGYAPTVSQPIVASPGVGSLALTGYAPTLAQTANQVVAPGVGSVAITGYAPTVTQAPGSPSLTPDTGTLTITGYAPSVVQTAPLTKIGGDDVPREEERIEVWEKRKPTPRRDATLDKVLQEAFEQATGKVAPVKAVAPIAKAKPTFIDYEDDDEEALLLML